MSDERLCERVGVDNAAQDALFLRHIEPVTLFLMRHFPGIEHEAVAAEVLTDALSYVGKHGVRKSFRALLLRIARQYGWNAKKRSRTREQFTTSWDALAEQLSPEDFAARVREEVVLAEVLRGLTDWERSCLLWRYADEWSEAQIAQRSGRSLSAVKSGLYRARQKLRADKTLTELYYRERKLSMKGWFLAGSKPQNYEIGATRDVTRSDKPSAYLRSKGGSESGGFGTLMQMIRAEKYLGKRMCLSGYVRADAVAEKAGLWMRVDILEKPISFDNMDDRPIRGTCDWQRCAVVLDVPAESTGIAFGILLAGPGAVWLTELTFEEVGTDIPVTGVNRLHADEPQNLCFELE